MSSIPARLSPELASWLRVQMMLAASRAQQPVIAEQRDLEHFSNSMLVVMTQLVPAILEAAPQVAERLAPNWRHAAERFEALSAGEEPLPSDEPAHLLEARQLLFRACEQRGLWPSAPRRPRLFRVPRH